MPDHTIIDYDECCALLILKELFPERYTDLVLDDKPDLQGRKIGIEVTIAIERDHQEAVSNWVKAITSTDENKKTKCIERMKQLGIDYAGTPQSWAGYEPTLGIVREAITSKAEMLRKGNYKLFEEYELFVFTETAMCDDNIQETLNFFTNQNIYECFKRIYIFERGHRLFVFRKEEYHMIEINTFEQSDRNMRARKIVEMAEEKKKKLQEISL